MIIPRLRVALFKPRASEWLVPELTKDPLILRGNQGQTYLNVWLLAPPGQQPLP